MPQTLTNGHANGCNDSTNSFDMEDGQTFLFTSESVGEGHPGELLSKKFVLSHLFMFNYKQFPYNCIITPIKGVI